MKIDGVSIQRAGNGFIICVTEADAPTPRPMQRWLAADMDEAIETVKNLLEGKTS